MEIINNTKIIGLIEIKPDQIDISKNKLRLEETPVDLETLIKSISTIGIIQPIVVEKIDGKIHLISGYRRLIAAIKAEVELVPCILTEGYLAQVYGFIEHLHHRRLNPVEEATGLVKFQKRFNCNQKELAKLISMSEQYVSDTLKLLTLPDDVKADIVRNNSVSKRELIKLARFTDENFILSRYEKQKRKPSKRTKTKKSGNTQNGISDTASNIKTTIKSINENIGALKNLSHDLIDEQDKANLINALKELNKITKTIKQKSYASYILSNMLNIFTKSK